MAYLLYPALYLYWIDHLKITWVYALKLAIK